MSKCLIKDDWLITEKNWRKKRKNYYWDKEKEFCKRDQRNRLYKKKEEFRQMLEYMNDDEAKDWF